jgi:division protein CdvB (Snf7/Vps24/ESCRT-III family)
MESGGATASSWSVVTTSDDAEKILADANVIAEQKMKDKFPTLPSPTLPSLEEST